MQEIPSFLPVARAHWLGAETACDSYSKEIAFSEVQLLSPVLKQAKILCVGLNYRDHAIESHMTIPEVHTIFLKLPNAVPPMHRLC